MGSTSMDDSFSSLAKSLASELQNMKSPDQLDDLERMRLAVMLEQAQRKIQPAMKFMMGLSLSSHDLLAARIAIAMGVFDAFASGDAEGMTTEDLASKTKGDQQFLVRILRLLTVYGFTEQLGPDKWRATPESLSLVTGGVPAMMVAHFYDHLKVNGSMLEFLEKSDFKTPTDYYNTPWQYGHNTKQTYWEWMASGPQLRQDSFNTVMTINQAYRGQDWFEFYPVEEKLITSSDGTVFVDLGGGLGHDAIGFRKKFPKLPGRVVLQDLPQVISRVKGPLPDGVEAQAYDAFTPQPVRGAKAYYLRTVLHDWPDTQALQILKNVRDAMNEDSILLINENFMPEEHSHPIPVQVDWVMMKSMSSLERTEKQWQQLINDAGFKLINTWRPTQPGPSPNGLFEAVPK